MESAQTPNIDLTGTALGERIVPLTPDDDAGWVNPQGYPAADMIAGSSALTAQAEHSMLMVSSGAGSLPMEEAQHNLQLKTGKPTTKNGNTKK